MSLCRHDNVYVDKANHNMVNMEDDIMKYVVTVMHTTNEGEFSTSIFNFDDINAAKAKAYTELAYGFGKTLKHCTVLITDSYANVVYRDTYVADNKE